MSWSDREVVLTKKKNQTDSKITAEEELNLKKLQFMTTKLNEVVEKWDREIKKKCQVVEGVKRNYDDCEDRILLDDLQKSLEQESEFSFQISKEQTDTFKIIFSNSIYNYRMSNNEESGVQIFKIGLIYPKSVIESKIIQTLGSANSVNIVPLIWQGGTIILLIFIGYYMFYTITTFISFSFDKLVRVFRNAENNKRISMNDEDFIDQPYEIKMTFSSFQTVKSTFDQASQAFDTGNDVDALIKYSVGLNFYEMVNNWMFAGIIANNLANIYLQNGKFDKSLEFYEKSIRYGNRRGMDQQIILSRKMNMVQAVSFYIKHIKYEQW